MGVLAVGMVVVPALGQAAEVALKGRYDAQGKRDPFVALVRNGRLVGAVKAGAQVGALPTLFGILWDPQGQSIALLNDGEAKVGDVVEGYKVLEITRDTVVLENGPEPIILQITFDEEPAPSATTANGR
jgi:hypothetical protein